MTNKKRERPRTPIVDAVLSKDIFRVRTAVEAGADVDEQDSDGRSPLHHASIQNHEEVVDLLLSLGAHAAVADKDGWTPLHFAARNHAVGVAKKLLRAGTPVDSVDANGNTPLFRAVFESKGRGDMISLLLESGADRHKQNNYGTSPAALAGTIANYDVKQWLKP